MTDLRKLALFAFLSAAAPLAAAEPASDPRADWLAKHALRVRSIAPGDRDFSDLAPLKKIWKDARIVLLGETTHGDGSTFLAKTRLIQFLHEEMGFDVLAFESGLYDCRKAWEAIKGGDDPVAAAPRGIFTLWTRSDQVQPLLRYLGERAKTPKPLELAGFDNQFTGSASAETLIPELTAYLERIGSPLLKSERWAAFTAVLRHVIDFDYEQNKAPKPGQEEAERILATFDALAQEIARRNEPEETFWLQWVESTRVFVQMEWVDDPDGHEAIRLRDAQMGKNLLWLARKAFPGRKIIVWAATFHEARNVATIDTGKGNEKRARMYRKVVPMGEVVAKQLGEPTYTLGFTALRGKTATTFRTQPPRELLPLSPGSLEDLMQQAGLDLAIVDFRNPPKGGEWLGEPLVSRQFGYAEMKADWTRIVDGLMVLREMQPSTTFLLSAPPLPTPPGRGGSK
jgi:erythromycin esterase